MNKLEIIAGADKCFNDFLQACITMDEDLFFQTCENKWSAAENMQHLIISTNITSMAFWLPKFLVRLIGGSPNRISRTPIELKEKYYKKLSEGGKATGRFVPKSISIKYGRQTLIDNWYKSTFKFIQSLLKKRSEKDLDSYLVKHPLLGRITLRELCYFTIFHTEHHLQSIQKNLLNK